MIYKYKINYKSLGGSRRRNKSSRKDERNRTYASMGHWLSYDRYDRRNINNYNEEGEYMYNTQNRNQENTNLQNTNQENTNLVNINTQQDPQSVPENTNQQNTNQQNTNQLNTNQENTNPEQDPQSVPENTNQQNQENQDNTNQENQENQPAYTSWEDQYNEDENISREVYRIKFRNYLILKKNVNKDLGDQIIETGIIPEKYKYIFDQWLKDELDSRMENPKVVQSYFDIPFLTEDEPTSSTSSSSINEPISSVSSSKSTSNMTDDKKSVSSENSVFDPDSKKIKELNNLLIQYHRMKLGDLSDEDINLLTDRLTEILNSDKIDQYMNNCFIREQNLIAKRDKLLNCKFHNFNMSSEKYQPNLWSDDLVNFINGYTHNQPGKPLIIFRDQVNIVNDSNTTGSIKKQASNFATLAMRNAINNYYEDILNRLRKECQEEIDRLKNPISEIDFPSFNKVFGKRK